MQRDAGVDLVVDVRSFPRSRRNPVYNTDRLPDALARDGIGYRHCLAFGGRRPRQPEVDDETNALWRVRSFHNYADYALGEAFAAAYGELVKLGGGARVALMCSEAVWWRCHRRIIADHLILDGHRVDHLMAPGRAERATPTPGARRDGTGRVVYPPA